MNNEFISELMRGNYILSQDKKAIYYGSLNQSVWIVDPLTNKIINMPVFTDEIKPIPLTPDLMKEYGFTKKDKVWQHENALNLYFLDLSVDENFVVCPCIKVAGVGLQAFSKAVCYCHELQNIFNVNTRLPL